ncbi:MAG TPA: glycosyltransferase family 2 protein [Lapillicoccus sp.]|nr:glycosyltransferase family 2 protein [Lapillicoccus sp.]
MPFPLEVVIPLRWNSARPRRDDEVGELAAYLRALSAWCDVTVVDGSDDVLRRQHIDAWSAHALVIRPEGTGTNGKVVGCLTGLRAARHDLVVIADDDVRHDATTLAALMDELGTADLVRPQNVYERWPWPARWDFARCLVNRAFGVDWPGTFALRRDAILAVGGWSTEVLFENLQLVRTASAHGLRVVNAPWLVVPRTPPTAGHFWSQRVRQAYDDFAQPGRLVAELALLPGLLALGTWRPQALAVPLAAAVVVGEIGRRRFGGVASPRTSALWCPLWLLERSVCVWIALGSWLRGGVRYHGRRVRHAALRVGASP